jgi:hypothetical protein
VKSAVHRREDQRDDERSDDESDPSLVAQCTERGDERRRDV